MQTQTLKITSQKAFQLYPTASAEFKAILEESFGKDFFSMKITDRIKTLDQLFAAGGKTLEEITEGCKSKDSAAYEVLKFGIAVLNEGKKVDHSDSTQIKLEPRFIHKPGLGLSYIGYDNWRTLTSVGPRLCYLDYDVMLHGVKLLEKYYHDFYN